MKKYFSLVIVLIFSLLIFVGCGGGGGGSEPGPTPTTSPTISPTTSPTVTPTISPSPTPTLAPNPPTNVSITIGTWAVIVWSPSSGGSSAVTHYNVYRGTSEDNIVFVGSTVDTEYDDEGILSLDSAYWYQISAVNQYGESAKTLPSRYDPTSTYITRIETWPKNATLQAGKTLGYGVMGYDRYNNEHDITLSCNYDVNPSSVGYFEEIPNTLLFHGLNTGDAVITFDYFSLQTSTNVTVTPATETQLFVHIPTGFTNGIGRIWRPDITGVILNFTINNGEVVGDVYVANGINPSTGDNYAYRIQIITNDGLTEYWWPDVTPDVYQAIGPGVVNYDVYFP